MSIAIVDYGMANLRSVQKAFALGRGRGEDHFPARGDRPAPTSWSCPGVGAFRDAIATLRERKLADADCRATSRKASSFWESAWDCKCCSMSATRMASTAGWAFLRGKCVRFDVDSTLGLKVPHMGWNQLILRNPSPLFPG